MENLNEDFKVLSELLRTAYKLISPITYHDDLKRLSPEFVQQDFEKNPGCYLRLGQGADHTLFPICNRYGYKDPQMINFSLKLATRIAKKQGDRGMEGMIIKLQKLSTKYSKPVPKTVSQASLQGLSTKTFNKKMRTPVSEWGNSDLSKDEKVKEFVQKLYKKHNVKESDTVKLMSDTNADSAYGTMLKGGAAIVGTVMLYNVLKSLYKRFSKEKDPEKRNELKKKIILQKQKIAKAKKK